MNPTPSTVPIDSGDDTANPISGAQVSGLSQILRLAGAAIVALAASVFLLQRWGSGDDLLRYGALLGLTAALGASGVACGLLLRENKAARTLLALAVALIPVHAAVLGGLIYSRFALDSLPGELPAFGVWVAPSDSIALLTACGALLVLLPIVYLGSKALARPHAIGVAVTTFAVNLPLLLPFRNATGIGIVIAALTALLIYLELHWVRNSPTLRTVEGRVMRLLWIAPILIAVVRTHLHDPTALFHGLVLMTAAGAIFAGARRLPQESPRLAGPVEYASLFPGIVGWATVAWSMSPQTERFILTMSLPLAATLVGLSFLSTTDGAFLRWSAVIVALAGAVLHLVTDPSVPSALLCLTLGIASVAYSLFSASWMLLACGLLATVTGLGFQVHYAIEAYSWSRWGGLALVGLVTILAAALLERHQATVIAHTRQLTHRMKTWSL